MNPLAWGVPQGVRAGQSLEGNWGGCREDVVGSWAWGRHLQEREGGTEHLSTQRWVCPLYSLLPTFLPFPHAQPPVLTAASPACRRL
jgi:hypothetical protein